MLGAGKMSRLRSAGASAACRPVSIYKIDRIPRLSSIKYPASSIQYPVQLRMQRFCPDNMAQLATKCRGLYYDNSA